MEFDGINKKKALERLMGNEVVFEKVVELFIDQYENGWMQINNLLENNDREGLKKYIHTLKGAAGNISADKLHVLAERADKKLKENIDAVIQVDDILDEIAIIVSNKSYFEYKRG